VVEMNDRDTVDWELGREEARREIDVDRQLAEYQVAVFEMLDAAMSETDASVFDMLDELDIKEPHGPWSPIDKRQEIADHLDIPPEDVDLSDG